MIDGFETREMTDIPVRAFVKSANGHLYKDQVLVLNNMKLQNGILIITLKTL